MLNSNTGERELAYIVKVDDILPIEGADRVEQAVIGGWRVMVQKGQFKVGDYAVYFEIDSKVPEEEPFMFLQAKHFSIKTQKYFKGTVLSQGLLMSLTDFPKALHQDSAGNWVDAKGYDIDVYYPLTKALKVIYSVAEDNDRKSNVNKYEKMYQRHIKLFKKSKILNKIYQTDWGKKLLFVFLGKKKDTRGWPYWVVKTDEERAQNQTWRFNPDNTETYIVTEKIDGTSTTATYKKSGKGKGFYICSRNVAFDKPEKACYYDTNVYVEMSEKYNLEAVLKDIAKEYKAEIVTIQGETYGAGIQKRTYGLTGHDFMAFNLIIDGERANSLIAKAILEKYQVPFVPILSNQYVLPATIEEMLEYAEGPSVIDGLPREGVVIRDHAGSDSFKAVSNSFLLEYHN